MDQWRAEGTAIVHSCKIEVWDGLVLPDISGLELVRDAWTFAPDLPVVRTTGSSVVDDVASEMLSRIVTEALRSEALVFAVC